ncbi:PP2C family protein-serine/threonine phosphatase [candidate division KSB1 bacterium]
MSSERTDIELLKYASSSLIKILDIDELLTEMLRIAQEGTEADRGTIYLVDNEKQEIYSRVLIGKEISEIRMPIGTGISGTVARTGKTIVVDDAYVHPQFNDQFDKSTGYRTKTMLSMPIKNVDNKVVGVFQIINKFDGEFNDMDVDFLSSLANYSALALELAHLHTEIVDKHKMEQEISIARLIQKNFLPVDIPIIEGYEVFGCNIPSATVSGDYYDYFKQSDNRWVIAIGDVSGKGIPAAMLTAQAQSYFKALTHYCSSVEEVAANLNKYILDSTAPGKFITFHFGCLDTAEHCYHFVNAGHNPPIHIKNDGTYTELSKGGPVLGFLPDMKYDSSKALLEEGDLIFCFTDGITEIFDRDEEEFGEERLYDFLLEHRDLPLSGIFVKLLMKLREFSDGKFHQDDMTVVAIKRK